MNDTVDIRIEGQHGSISGLEWREVPPFAVITGVNGAGKSQLLEIIAASYNALRSRPSDVSPPRIQANVVIEGTEFVTGEVFHSYGEWAAPNADTATEQDIKDAIRSLYDSVRSSAVQKEPPPPWLKEFMDAVFARLNITAEQAANLALERFYENLTPAELWDLRWPMRNGSVAFLFLSYLLFEKDARARGRSEEEIRRFYGEPPWALLNEILETSGLPLRVVHPHSIRPSSLAYDAHYSVCLKDIERDLEVPFRGLSSGERVIMSTMLWRYSAHHGVRHPRFLLLDEPDAHLHPSLTRRFLEVVRKVFVEERGVRVIMTTHSPSTVSIAPEESLFEMRRTQPRIRPATSKARAVAVLTDGFVAVQEASQTILFEGKDDPPFYEQVWDLLTERTGISEPGPLEPFPSLVFVYGQGKNTVELMVPQMRSHGLQSFHGILDKDDSNVPSDGVYVIGRNGMENYLYDPLNVWLLLHSKGQAPDVPGVTVSRGRGAFVRNLSEDRLQRIAEAVLVKVEGMLANLRSEERTEEDVPYVNDKRLRYPRWFLYRDDKEIEGAFRQAFGYHLLTGRELLSSYATLNMVPQDLLDLLRTIQSSGKP